VDDLLSMMDHAGVERALLVQPFTAYLYDNRYAMAAARERPDRFRALFTVDPDSNPVHDLRSWADEGGACGVRCFSMGRGSSSWFSSDASEAFWNAIATLGLALFVTVALTELPLLRLKIETHPDLVVVIEHAAYAQLGLNNATEAMDLLLLANLPNVYVKVTTMTLDNARERGARPTDVIEQLAQSFGCDRLMWGSNYSATHDRSYEELSAIALEASSTLSHSERAGFLGLTARQLCWP
jgi:predicted TIM-barrel fold metal-dependent hydrolase